MAKKAAAEQTAYGTGLKFRGLRSNHPIKSRYMAAFLAIVFGIIGANQFYLRNIVKGLLKIVFSAIFIVLDAIFDPPFVLIPVVLSVIAGLVYLIQSDEAFAKANHVRTI